MANDWFRLPDAQRADGTHFPRYTDQVGVSGFSGNRVDVEPEWVVRVFGDKQTLNSIRQEADAERIKPQDAVSLFNDADVSHLEQTERPWDQSELNSRFDA